MENSTLTAVAHAIPIRRQQLGGFTLIELLVVIAIIGVLAALAIPSFQGLIAGTNVTSVVNSFVSDTRYARGEAMRRGKSITICRSTNPSAPIPACSTGDGLAVGGWKEGWIVFEDLDSDGVYDAGETVLRVQEGFGTIGNMYAVGSASISAVSTGNNITYDATGRAIGQQGRWIVHASGNLISDTRYARTLCMNSVGRVRLLQGEVAC